MSQKFKLNLPEIDITQNFPLEKIFITSDLHLFHTNIIKYTDRPFEYSEDGCHEMTEFILSKFDVLPSDCLVWNLGDVLLNRHVSAECAAVTVKRMGQGRTVNLFVKEDYFLSEYNRRYPKQKVNPADYINVCMDANRFEILPLQLVQEYSSK